VAAAGHTGDLATARAGRTSDDPAVRATALAALERLAQLDDGELAAALTDPAVTVRRRAAQLAAGHPEVDLRAALDDPDPAVVEMASWAAGEHGAVRDEVLDRLLALADGADEPLVREAAVAALGALGDERAVPVILRATTDKPAIRRRAVLALAPFDGPEVDHAVERALGDRDWQVRQAAEDLRRAQR
jgi:HEAT repeat protein